MLLYTVILTFGRLVIDNLLSGTDTIQEPACI